MPELVLEGEEILDRGEGLGGFGLTEGAGELGGGEAAGGGEGGGICSGAGENLEEGVVAVGVGRGNGALRRNWALRGIGAQRGRGTRGAGRGFGM
ncbi:MAG: hypothetical protein IPJ41_12765 [Phycisphaerales bacterium]|nr:hypothetical protein [Phycisphaerales bacterium]